MQQREEKLRDCKIEQEESKYKSCTFQPETNHQTPKNYIHYTRKQPASNSYSKLYQLKRRNK